MTASVILDFNTVATADKFGNVSVVSMRDHVLMECILALYRYGCLKIHLMRLTKTRLEQEQFGIADG